MRNHQLFLKLSVLCAVLSGCGGSDSGDSAFNPANDVDLVFSTFDLEDLTGKPANLKHTRFYDAYLGLEPADAGDTASKALATALRNHIDAFLGHTRNDTDTGFVRVRNPLDLMNQVVASTEVDNFNAGRQYISGLIDNGVAGTYNTRANGASIRFVDQAATSSGAPLANRQWIFDTLYWNYTPQGADGTSGFEKVFRVIQYVARNGAGDDAAATQQLTSLTSSSQFDAIQFSSEGYNAAEFTIASFASRSLGDMELRQDFVMDKTDTLFLKNSGVSLGAETPDCIRVELDYPLSRVLIYTSDGEPINHDDDGDPQTPEVDNPAYCGHQQPGDEAHSYNTITLALRQ
ncbi:hypothetical protein [Marinobacter mobilis]|uniref:Lipoprotein n=1 Tax=Marinobacter mobilis TaxID=488533 RepID=A0A1H2W4A2_9GAMM|nr:hypothetical protein [Marinobacter mobilis]SDW75094.1 hypothetical protein SAMN04487960_10441 [Marinobacter mobilis]SDX52343.1 hypothetical protein SAMN04487960_110140 [Marinobacter mobilis]